MKIASITFLKRIAARIRDDNVSLVSAGVAFFVCLGVFPGLAATVFVLQLFADPSHLQGIIERLSGVLPEDTSQILVSQVQRFSETRAAAAGIGAKTPIIGYAVLLWSASRGTRAIIRALDLIYDQSAGRGFLKTLLVATCLTVCLIVFLLVMIAFEILLPYAFHFFGLEQNLVYLRWPLLLVVLCGVLALLYRFATRRSTPQWKSIATGAGAASVLWVAGSVLFSWYLSHIGRLPFVYGSVSAIIGFLIWMWMSAFFVMLGAEIDAELSGRRKPQKISRGNAITSSK